MRLHPLSPGSLPRLGAAARRAAPGAIAAGLVLAAGCGDAGTDPLAVVLTPETQAALTVGEELATLPEWLERTGPRESAAHRAEILWQDSWHAPGPTRALEARRSAYRMAVPLLASRMSESQVAEMVAEVEEALWTVDQVRELRSLPLPLATAVGLAARHALAARQALDSGEVELALEEALEGGDHLREVTPRRTAVRLLDLADSALRRESGSATYSMEDRERAVRLARGARQALEAGDHPRATRRAFYACQLLGVEPGDSLTSYAGGH